MEEGRRGINGRKAERKGKGRINEGMIKGWKILKEGY
jgi:hypothetical protein